MGRGADPNGISIPASLAGDGDIYNSSIVVGGTLNTFGGMLTLSSSQLLSYYSDVAMKGNPQIYNSTFYGSVSTGQPYVLNSTFSGDLRDNARVLNSHTAGSLQDNATLENMNMGVGHLVGNSYVNNVNMVALPPNNFLVHTGGYCGWEYVEKDSNGVVTAIHLSWTSVPFDSGESPRYGCLSHL